MIEACRENKIANGEYLFQSHDYRHTVATMFMTVMYHCKVLGIILDILMKR